MMRLLKVELTRFRSRRVNQVALLGILGVMLITIFGSWRTSVPLSEAEVAQIQASYDNELQRWEEDKEQIIADCQAQEAADQEVDPAANYNCEQGGPGSIDGWMYGPSSFADRASSIIPDFGVLLLFTAFAMGVSFIAAEYSSGAIGNWLTFEPRRGRVYGTKVGASALSTLPIALFAAGLLVAGTWFVYSLNGNVGTMTGETWRTLGEGGLRLALLAAGLAMFGVAMGTIVRHTAAAIGILVGYMIVVEGIVASLFEGLRPWLLNLNLTAVLKGGTTYGVTVCEAGPTGQQNCTWIEETVSLGQGAAVIGGLLLVVLAVAALVFRRRDVN